jgi:tetratricopeptide (TPR) repeat protein
MKSVSIDPGFARGYYNIGIVSGKLGKYQEEVEAYKKTLSVKPDYPGAQNALAIAHNSLGSFYNKNGKYKEAVDEFKQAIKIKPDLAEAYYNLGITYVALGNRKSAGEQHKALQKINESLAELLFKKMSEDENKKK